jgi:hypothetical protein
MRVIVEQLVEWRLAGETEVLGENLPKSQFVHHKSHMTRPRSRTRAAAVGSQRLTAWAMAQPYFIYTHEILYGELIVSAKLVLKVFSGIASFDS